MPATLLHIGLLSVDPATRNFGGLRMSSLEQFATTSNTTRVLSSHIKVRLAISGLLAFLTSSVAGFISGDPIAFILNLSEKLAEFAPL